MRLSVFINGSNRAEYTRKSQLTEDESKRHKNNKGSYAVRTEINFVLRKNGGHRPSNLGGRSIVVVSE